MSNAFLKSRKTQTVGIFKNLAEIAIDSLNYLEHIVCLDIEMNSSPIREVITKHINSNSVHECFTKFRGAFHNFLERQASNKDTEVTNVW